MMEREIKLKLGHVAFLQRLRESGLRYKVSVSFATEDIYFDDDKCSLLLEDKAFRVRILGNRVLVTYKGPRRQGVHKEREEIEGALRSEDCVRALKAIGVDAGCSSQEEVIRSLELAGFSEKLRVRKRRTIVQVEGISDLIFLDRVQGLGEFVEIEGENPIELVEKLDLTCRVVRPSYVELLAFLEH